VVSGTPPPIPPPIPPLATVAWERATRIIRSRYPPVDLFEDIADPADWELIAAAEAKANPRLSEAMGRLDLVPPHRRVAGPGASAVMAPFTHISPDRPTRFSAGHYGVYYCGDRYEVALFETIHHHERFMRATSQAPGWTSEFRELVGRLDARLHDLRTDPGAWAAELDPARYLAGQALGGALREAGSDGIVYPSVRYPSGDCAGVFWPDVVAIPVQGRHLAYHWDGTRVDRVRELDTGRIFDVQP